MPGNLLTTINPGGSRNFYDHPGSTPWAELRSRLEKIEGLDLTGTYPGIAQAWIDFTFRGFKFSIDTQLGDYWFMVDDPECPENILLEIADACEG